ncbi:VanZ family protein [Romboutsia ilealis]|uniref:VanZ family protein n=1 Tax=Romboutsia ilealis TaxID=1115758 RepID=UPI0025B7814E|nr:VanZ family protein [Romboutsia ilealis]
MKKLIVIMLVVFSLGGMYFFSSQNAHVSGKQSQEVVKFIDKIRDKVTLKDKKLIKIQTNIYDKLKKLGTKSYIVRKMAHFSIYALIGTSLLLFIYEFSKKLLLSSLIAFFLSIIYACYDEYRQLSIPGRSGSIKDVFIDSSGALTGIILTFIIISIIKIIVSLLKNSLNKKDLSEEEFNN